MNILIADDESMACQHLSGMVESMPGCYDVGHAGNGIEAVYKAYDLDIDAVLMDIRMPRMSGLEAARHISEFENPPAVVFTTAYGEHALEAFGVHARGFLLKPVHPDRLTEALERVRRHSMRKVAEPAMFDETGDNYVCCRIRQGLDLIALNRIIYIKSNSKCTMIHHLRGCSMSEQPLKVFERQFGDRVLRVHRNALVNKAYVNGLEKGCDGTHFAVLRASNEKLEVSRRNLPRLRDYLQDFMKPRVAIRRREQFLTRYEVTKEEGQPQQKEQ